jgi:hypothetical protein
MRRLWTYGNFLFFENGNWEEPFIDEISDILIELRDIQFIIEIDTVNYFERNVPLRAIHIKISDQERRMFSFRDIVPTLLRIGEYLQLIGQSREIIVAVLHEEWYLPLDMSIREFREQEFYGLDIYIF